MPQKQTKKPTRSTAMKQRAISTDLTWKQRLKELAAFKREHGHCNVQQSYSPNTTLGRWVSYVRRLKRTGAIDSELTRRLDKLGFTWELRHRVVFRRDWNTMIAALMAFKKEHGHCCVPWQTAKYRALSIWLASVRRRKKVGLLNPGHIRQLDRLDVSWEPNDKRWEDQFADLVKYRAKYGNCNVPYDCSDNPKLAEWVRMQRRFRKRNTLPQDRLERLNKIGFVWTSTTREEAWESKYAALVKYQQAHGHCRVPTVSKVHASLGWWVSGMRGKRRRGKLSDERIQRLNQLGFVWYGGEERGD